MYLNFEGVCLDNGAETSLCGLSQAGAYAQFMLFSFNLGEYNSLFPFGGKKTPRIGTIVAFMPKPGYYSIEVRVYFVAFNIPMLLGLDALENFGTHMNSGKKLLVHDKARWSLPLTIKADQVYLELDPQIFFTVTELRKMQDRFFHQTIDNLFHLIKGA